MSLTEKKVVGEFQRDFGRIVSAFEGGDVGYGDRVIEYRATPESSFNGFDEERDRVESRTTCGYKSTIYAPIYMKRYM